MPRCGARHTPRSGSWLSAASDRILFPGLAAWGHTLPGGQLDNKHRLAPVWAKFVELLRRFPSSFRNETMPTNRTIKL